MDYIDDIEEHWERFYRRCKDCPYFEQRQVEGEPEGVQEWRCNYYNVSDIVQIKECAIHERKKWEELKEIFKITGSK